MAGDYNGESKIDITNLSRHATAGKVILENRDQQSSPKTTYLFVPELTAELVKVNSLPAPSLQYLF